MCVWCVCCVLCVVCVCVCVCVCCVCGGGGVCVCVVCLFDIHELNAVSLGEDYMFFDQWQTGLFEKPVVIFAQRYWFRVYTLN